MRCLSFSLFNLFFRQHLFFTNPFHAWPWLYSRECLATKATHRQGICCNLPKYIKKGLIRLVHLVHYFLTDCHMGWWLWWQQRLISFALPPKIRIIWSLFRGPFDLWEHHWLKGYDDDVGNLWYRNFVQFSSASLLFHSILSHSELSKEVN